MHIITFRHLTDDQRNEVEKWLRKNNADPQKIRREFSDVNRFASLLQGDFPKQIDLNNYPRGCRVAFKVQNWTTFNFKVLAKYNMCLGKDLINELALGTRGAIEVVIYEMLCLVKQQEQNVAKRKNGQISVLWKNENNVPAKKKAGVKVAPRPRIQEEPEVVVATEENSDEPATFDIVNECSHIILQATPTRILYHLNESNNVEGQEEDAETDVQRNEEEVVEAVEPTQDEADAVVITEENSEEAVALEMDNEDINNIVQATSRMLLYSFYEDLYLGGQEMDAEINKEEVTAVEPTQDEADAVVTAEENKEEAVLVDIDDEDMNTLQATSRMILCSLYEDIFRDRQDKDSVTQMWNERMTSLESELQCKQDRLLQMSQVIATLPEDIQRLFKPEDNEVQSSP